MICVVVVVVVAVVVVVVVVLLSTAPTSNKSIVTFSNKEWRSSLQKWRIGTAYY